MTYTMTKHKFKYKSDQKEVRYEIHCKVTQNSSNFALLRLGLVIVQNTRRHW